MAKVQVGFIGLPSRKGFLDLLFDPGRAIVGQECGSVSVGLGFKHSRNRDRIPLCVSNDVRDGVNVIRSLSICIEWRDQPGIICGGFCLF